MFHRLLDELENRASSVRLGLRVETEGSCKHRREKVITKLFLSAGNRIAHLFSDTAHVNRSFPSKIYKSGKHSSVASTKWFQSHTSVVTTWNVNVRHRRQQIDPKMKPITTVTNETGKQDDDNQSHARVVPRSTQQRSDEHFQLKIFPSSCCLITQSLNFFLDQLLLELGSFFNAGCNFCMHLPSFPWTTVDMCSRQNKDKSQFLARENWQKINGSGHRWHLSANQGSKAVVISLT